MRYERFFMAEKAYHVTVSATLHSDSRSKAVRRAILIAQSFKPMRLSSNSIIDKLKYTWWFLYPITAIAVGWYLYGRIRLSYLFGMDRRKALDALSFDILHNHLLVAFLFITCYVASWLWLGIIIIALITRTITFKAIDCLKVILMGATIILFLF
jgi:hypothetical protein